MISRRRLLKASAAVSVSVLGAGLARPASAAAPATCRLRLQNNSGSNTAFAYIAGSDPNQGYRRGFIDQAGRWQYLVNPPSDGTPLPDDAFAIPLNSSGGPAVELVLPRISSGRFWLVADDRITWKVNQPSGPDPWPGLVQPSPTNQTDPNYRKAWTFCELTFDDANIYSNISYVDHVTLPIAMETVSLTGTVQRVAPLPDDALAAIASDLVAQQGTDGAPWDRLVLKDADRILRVLAPQKYIDVDPAAFADYWNAYLAAVWRYYTDRDLVVDTQVRGTFTGRVRNGAFVFDGLDDHGHPYTMPSAKDIFGCATGPLYDSGDDDRGAVTARLAAALNRSTLLLSGGDRQPNGVTAAEYYDPERGTRGDYTGTTTNHYARIVHKYANVGYAFPYDDISPTGSASVDGHISEPNPAAMTVALGRGGSGSGGGGGTVSAYSRIEAEQYSEQFGTQTEACSDVGGGQDVGWLRPGDWLRYNGVDFGGTPPRQFVPRVASGAASGISGGIEVRLDSLNAPAIATVAVGNTGGWQSWTNKPKNIDTPVTGTHDVFLVFTGSGTADFVNVNWFTFSAT
jgi:hypothetical protein